MTALTSTKRCSARAALAEALAARDAAAGKLAEAHAALTDFDINFDKTEQSYFTADKALDAAKEALKEALRSFGGNEQAILVDVIKTERPHPRDMTKKAEAAYTVAKENYVLAQEGQARLRAMKTAAEDSLTYAERQVAKAADVVLQTCIPDLLEAAETARREAEKREAALWYASRELDGVHVNYGITEDPVAKRVRSFLRGYDKPDFESLTRPWAQAREALLVNADAPLP